MVTMRARLAWQWRLPDARAGVGASLFAHPRPDHGERSSKVFMVFETTVWFLRRFPTFEVDYGSYV